MIAIFIFVPEHASMIGHRWPTKRTSLDGHIAAQFHRLCRFCQLWPTR